MQIEIHEFSTGITVEGNENNWFSRGFTGKYMNATLEEIPAVVQKAISNREFAVAERASTDNPTLIAREIGDKQEEWSVIAVVTRARDDFGRYLSVYRYFLTEGRGNIATILRWMNNKPLVFNPFDLKDIGQVHHYSYQENTTIPINNFQEFITEEIPVIIPFNKSCPPLIINSIAQEKAGDKLIAWAYNVTGLEVPKSFYVIYPASGESEENLRKIISNQSNNDGKIISGEGIKKAISGLISRDKVKLEHLQTLEEALTNEDIEPKYWEEFFNSRGAKDAISQKLYSAQMVRLLTLKAMFIPDSLPTFLYWMENRQGKDQEHWETSLIFQINIAQELRPIVENAPQLSAKIEAGITLILLRLLDEPELLNSLVKLLKNKQGIWGNSYRYGIRNYLENDLNLMPKFARLQQSNLTEELEKLEFKLKNDQDWEQIFNELTNFWQYNVRKDIIEKYQVWAELFEQFKDYKLAALFYQISFNQVPKSVFGKLCKFSWGTNFKTTIYTITVYREVDLLEHKILELINILQIIVSYLIKGLQLLDDYRYHLLLIFITVLVILNLFTIFIVRENVYDIFKIIIQNKANN